MKLNLWLFGILMTLVVGTYFFQEKRVEENFKKSLVAGKLVKGQINSIETPTFKATLVANRWIFENELLSYNDLSRLVTMLETVKEVKALEADPNVEGINFKLNETSYFLGSMNLDQSGFYFKVNDKNFVAIIETDSRQIHSEGENLNVIKYNELKSLLMKTQVELVEKQLFRYYPDLQFETVLVKPDGALDFELDFKNNTTLPAPMKGIEVHQELGNKFQALVREIKIKKKVKADPKLKKNKMGEITFLPQEMKWEVFLPHKNKADVYLFDSQGNAYEMIGGTLKVFLIQLQDYWDKKIIPPSDFKNFDVLSVTLSQGTDELTIKVKNREPLEYESDQKIKLNKVEMLFQVIFNLANFDQGQRVSPMTTSQYRQLLSEDNLRMEIMGQDLVMVSYGQELIVANITQEYKVHFNRIENFPLNIKDMLE